MSEQNSQPIPTLLRGIFWIVALVLFAGLLLFFAPQLISERWPWKILPFTQRFLGAIYLAEMIAIIFTLRSATWSVAKVTLPQSVVFTAVVSLVSLIHPANFNFQRPTVWAWFIIYIGPMLILAWFWWQYRASVHSGSPPSPLWRRILLAEAVILGLYGLAVLFAPVWAVSFWPWGIDAFNGQVYSALFLTGAIGAWLLAKYATAQGMLAFGASQATLGIASIIGLILANNQVMAERKVQWLNIGSLVWLGAFALLAIIGLGLINQSRRVQD